MDIIKYKLFENKQPFIYSNKNIIQELCICMLLINNSFLDNLLDKGIKSRYQNNTDIFVGDLKSLLQTQNNRLKLGKFINNQCVEDTDLGKLNKVFDNIDFNIEKDWNKLINARLIFRNIYDKLLIANDSKLEEDLIKNIYWIGVNKNDNDKEDIVIELTTGQQFSFFLDKSLSVIKTSSFAKLGEDLLGSSIESLYNKDYIIKWDKLVQEWVKNIYENCNKNYQVHIEKYLEPTRINTIRWFEYFKLKHKDPRYRNLGEHIQEFDKNILFLSDLMREIWKNKEMCFKEVEKTDDKWKEVKKYVLNSRILEHLLTETLLSKDKGDIKKLKSGYKLASGRIKMKLIKNIVEKLGSTTRETYYLGNNGNNFIKMPNRHFFRKYYNDLDVTFDYHVKLNKETNEKKNPDENFTIKINFYLDKKKLLDGTIEVRFGGGDITSKLSTRYKFNISDKFNLIISEKILEK